MNRQTRCSRLLKRMGAGVAVAALVGVVSTLPAANASPGDSESRAASLAGWSLPVNVGEATYQYDYTPAIDAAGNALIPARLGTGSSTRVAVFSRTADGVVSGPTEFGPGASPTVRLADNGQAILVWARSYERWFSRRSADGQWTAPRQLTGSQDRVDFHWGMDDAGNAVVVFGTLGRGTDPARASMIRIDSDGTVEPAVPLGGLSSLDVAVSPNGNTLITWMDPDSVVHVRTGNARGGPWTSTTTRRSPCGNVLKPLVNDAGDMMIGAITNPCVYTMERQDDGTWSDWIQGLPSTDFAPTPTGSMAMSPDGDVMLITETYNPESGIQVLFSARKPAGEAWEKPVLLADIQASTRYASVIAASDGSFVATWNGRPTSYGQQVAVARPGEKFGAPITLGTTFSGASGALAADEGRVMAVWMSARDLPQTVLSILDLS
ncbi:hypothetical protein [Flindersiella endophytica]